MQLNQNQYGLMEIKQLLNSNDLDELLQDRYSTLLHQSQLDLELSKLYLYHLNLQKKRQTILQQIQLLKDKLNQFNKIATPKKLPKEISKSNKDEENSFSYNNTNKLKRTRRNANQISRHFRCPVQTCKKQYGSQGSLNQHIKLKHEYLVKNYESWVFEPKKQQKQQQQ